MEEIKIEHGIDVTSIAQNEKFVKYKINDMKGALKGLNFNANIIQFTMNGTRVDGSVGECKVFVKYSHKDDFKRKILKAADCFRKECTFYETVAPQLYKLQDEVDIAMIKRFKIPKLLESSNLQYKEYVALEDLSVNGYQKFDHLRSLDCRHLRLMIKKIANFHGTAFAWKHKNRESYNHSVRDIKYDQMYSMGMNPHIMTYITEGLEFLKNVLTNEQYIMEINKVVGNLSIVVDYLSSVRAAEPYDTICHGDFWINNFWFMYNSENKPIDVCFFDWQMLRCGSVYNDLFYMLFLCTDTDTRKLYFKDALAWYYADLREVLETFELDAENVYPEMAFRDDEKKFAPLGLILGLTCTIGMTADPKNVPDIAKLLGGEKQTVRNEIESTFSELGLQRIQEILSDYISYGYS